MAAARTPRRDRPAERTPRSTCRQRHARPATTRAGQTATATRRTARARAPVARDRPREAWDLPSAAAPTGSPIGAAIGPRTPVRRALVVRVTVRRSGSMRPRRPARRPRIAPARARRVFTSGARAPRPVTRLCVGRDRRRPRVRRRPCRFVRGKRAIARAPVSRCARRCEPERRLAQAISAAS